MPLNVDPPSNQVSTGAVGSPGSRPGEENTPEASFWMALRDSMMVELDVLKAPGGLAESVVQGAAAEDDTSMESGLLSPLPSFVEQSLPQGGETLPAVSTSLGPAPSLKVDHNLTGAVSGVDTEVRVMAGGNEVSFDDALSLEELANGPRRANALGVTAAAAVRSEADPTMQVSRVLSSQSAKGSSEAPLSPPVVETDLVDELLALDRGLGNLVSPTQSFSAVHADPKVSPVNGVISLQNPNWNSALATRVVWLLNNNLNLAELRLEPPHLGTLEVEVYADAEQVQVGFVSGSEAARDILESALPRLRQIMAESGFAQVEVSVSNQDSAQGELAREGDESQTRPMQQETKTEEGSEGNLTQSSSALGIDYFV